MCGRSHRDLEISLKGTVCPYLDASVTAQVEVKLGRVGDLRVHGGACWNVPAFPNLEQHRSPLDTSRGQHSKASKPPSPRGLPRRGFSGRGGPTCTSSNWPIHLLSAPVSQYNLINTTNQIKFVPALSGRLSFSSCLIQALKGNAVPCLHHRTRV